MVAFHGKTRFVQPFEHEVRIIDALAAGAITSGSGRRIDLVELNGVSLDKIDLRVEDFTATGVVQDAYTVKVFYEGTIAGESTTVTGLGTGIATVGTTNISEAVSLSADGQKFDKAIVGLEFSGGTESGATFSIQAAVNIKGDSRGHEVGQAAGGNFSFVKPGTSVAFNATTTDFDVTFGAEETAKS